MDATFFSSSGCHFGWHLIRDECNDHSSEMTVDMSEVYICLSTPKLTTETDWFLKLKLKLLLEKVNKIEIKDRGFWNLKSEIKFRN